MIQLIAALQPLLVGAVLLWSASLKLSRHRAATAARQSALVPLIGERFALPAYRVLGGVELIAGGLLVLPPALWTEAAAGAVLATGFLAYLGYARRAAPTSSCGCLSARRTPIAWRSFARAGALLLAALAGTAAAGDWLSALAARPVALGAVLLAEAAAIVALSPELDTLWLLPARRAWARVTHPLRGGSGVPLLSSVQQLQQSEAYRRLGALLRSDVREHWDEGPWRFVSYAARYHGRPVTAVFAVPLLRYEPESVRVAMVDDATGGTLLVFRSTMDAAPSSTWDMGGPVDQATAAGAVYAV